MSADTSHRFFASEFVSRHQSLQLNFFVAVHHDLQTVAQYFDTVVLLNMRLVAAGPIATTFTDENLHRTYGGRLTILSQAAEALLTQRARDEGRR